MKKSFKACLAILVLFLMPVATYASTLSTAYSYDFTNANGMLNYAPDGSLNLAGSIVMTPLPNGAGSLSGLNYSVILPSDGTNDGHWANGTITITQNSTTILNAHLNDVSMQTKDSGYSLTLGTVKDSFFSATLDSSVTNLMKLPSTSVFDSTLSYYFVSFVPVNLSGPFFGMVLDGNVHGTTTPTPIPAAAWLFLSGFAGIAGLRRRNKK